MSDRQTKKNEKEAKRQSEIAKKENERLQGLPVNKFLNTRNDDGSLKYKTADKIQKYVYIQYDPILKDMRLINSMIHDIRHKLALIKLHEPEYNENKQITLYNSNGGVLSREELYAELIMYRQAVHSRLCSIREDIINKLFVKVDGQVFTFEMFDDYVLKCDEVIRGMGYELFPESVKIIYPL